MKTLMHLTCARATALFATALLYSVPGLLQADEPVGTTAQRLDDAANHAGKARTAAEISTTFTNFAGSAENATALVTGLHDGATITITTTVNGQVVATEFQPTTGQLGYGNTFISLALAQESLAKAGITQPTPEQLVAALNGGTVTGSNGTAVTLAGVLSLRAAGNGWGDIAQTLGVKLGPVVKSLHVAHQHIGHPDKPLTAAKPGVISRGVERAGRPERVARPVLAGSPGTSHRPIPPPAMQPVRAGKP
jgi:hypothetical protein